MMRDEKRTVYARLGGYDAIRAVAMAPSPP